MHEASVNPALIRIILIVAILAVPQIIRAVLAKKAKQVARPSVNKAAPLGEALREAMRQSAEQARARRGELQIDPGAFQLKEQFQQPPTIQPESSFLPSLLLLALLVCLCLMAYRYFAA